LCGAVPSCVGLGSFSPIRGFCFLYHLEPLYSALPWRCTIRTSQLGIGHIGLQPEVRIEKNSREKAEKTKGREKLKTGIAINFGIRENTYL
jgi:hypothetical protein